MTPHQTVAVAVRMFAIWLLFHFGRDVFSIYYASPDVIGRANALTLALVAFLITCLVSAFLWAFPLTVARKLLPPVASEPSPRASAETWLNVGCALIGLWVISSAAPLLFRDLLMQHFYAQEFQSSGFNPFIVRSGAEIVVAIWLICGARGVLEILRWVRSAGTRKSSN